MLGRHRRARRSDLRPARAILCVSARWVTRGIAVTALANPRTIHNFGVFPAALFEIRYPAPGDPSLAARIAELLAPQPVTLDEGRDRDSLGFDHGTWSVLCKAYPQADIPVMQLSMDGTRNAAFHYEIGRRLRPLRDDGVLIVGTGNIVQNLRQMNVRDRNAAPYEWARRFNDHIRGAIEDDQPERWRSRRSDGTRRKACRRRNISCRCSTSSARATPATGRRSGGTTSSTARSETV